MPLPSFCLYWISQQEILLNIINMKGISRVSSHHCQMISHFPHRSTICPTFALEGPSVAQSLTFMKLLPIGWVSLSLIGSKFRATVEVWVIWFCSTFTKIIWWFLSVLVDMNKTLNLPHYLKSCFTGNISSCSPFVVCVCQKIIDNFRHSICFSLPRHACMLHFNSDKNMVMNAGDHFRRLFFFSHEGSCC